MILLTLDTRDMPDTDRFPEYLKNYLRDLILDSVDDLKLALFTAYFKVVDNLYTNNGKTPVRAKDIVIMGANNLVWDRFETEYKLSIDNNTTIYGLRNQKVVTLCKEINYGTSLIKGYPIFTDCADKVKKEYQKIVYMYEEEQ